LLILSFIFIGGFLIWVSQLKIPSIQELENLKMSQATKIYDRTGQVVLYNIYQDEKRTIVPLSQISKYLQ
jgi:penicillin-binding protein 1A